MRLRTAVRRLDAFVLPPLADALARLGRGAVRLRLMTVAALVLAVVAAVAAVWAAEREPIGDPTPGRATLVGVGRGDSIPAYARTSGAELADLVARGPAVDTYALVTLTAYLGPDRLVPVVAGVGVIAGYARVPLPHVQTELVRFSAWRVPQDVVSAMDLTAERKETEAIDLSRRLASLGPDAPTDLRDVYDTGARIAAAEAAAYRERCSCVYAIVVRATPALLAGVADRPEVRVVDAAPEVKRLDRAVFLPPLPEHGQISATSETDVGATLLPGP